MTGTAGELLAAVVAVGSERRFARLTLEDDPFAPRLGGHEEEALSYAFVAGQTAADETANAYGRDPEAVAAALGLAVNRDSLEAKAGSSVRLSEYGDRPPEIVLHMDSLDAAQETIQAHGLESLLGFSDPQPAQVAHEIYHHLETKHLTAGTAGFRLPVLDLGPLHLRRTFPSLSEIAADRFAIALLGLRVPPRAIHFLVVYQHNPAYAWQLLDRLRSLPE
ncbi:MAG: hypothetical protein M1401_06300 [Chloroflexi bacterium]|nr:hypothetical protein [Chloroflexota bacterium]